MAKEPSDATPRILRQIQETLAEHGRVLADHGRVLADHGRRLDALETLMQEVSGRLGEIRTGMMTVLGYVTHVDNRHKEMRREIDDRKRRVGALEEKV